MDTDEALRTILRRLNAQDDKLEYLIGLSEHSNMELKRMSGTQNAIDQAVTALQSQVAQSTAVEASAITLITGLVGQLQAALAADNINPADATNINAVITQLQSSASSLAAAITANTPASPAPAAITVQPGASVAGGAGATVQSPSPAAGAASVAGGGAVATATPAAVVNPTTVAGGAVASGQPTPAFTGGSV